MQTIVRWLTRLLLVLVVLVVAVTGTIYYLAVRSQPDYSARHNVGGIQSPVEIVRSEHNVPHIIADSNEDAFFGLGFAHAQDRLWQMLLWRRAAQGRLSEMFGSATLQTDILMRSLDLYGVAAGAVDKQDARTQRILEAYSAGVNAWVQTVNGGELDRLAPEFLMFRTEFRPWQPVDSLAILNLQGLRLSTHLDLEVRRQMALTRVSPERVLDLIPPDPESKLTNVAANLDSGGSLEAADAARGAQWNRHVGTQWLAQLTLAPTAGRAGASNAWAVAPTRTESGKAILANDPHLPLSAPSIWMLARLELSNGGVIGGTLPGVPLVVVGRTSRVAWGLTYSYVDNQDLYFEKLDPESSNRYLSPQGYKAFRSRDTVIPVKNEQPHVARLMWTDNGPIIDPMHYGIGDIQPEGYRMSLAWTLLDAENTTMSGAVGIMMASTLDEALEASKKVTAPSFNLVIADQDEIVHQLIGTVPLRSQLHRTRGLTPSEGWLNRNRWQGVVPHFMLPTVRSPEAGYVANTNNRMAQRDYPLHISHDWGDQLRIERLTRILAASDVHSLEGTIAIQTDVVSLAARHLLPNMASNLWHLADRETADGTVQRRNRALRLLANWHGKMDVLSAEPLIYAAWLRSLQRLLTKDELGSLFPAFSEPDIAFIDRVFRNVKGAAVWCDIKQTPQKESCNEISRIALDDSLDYLGSEFGEDMSDWSWGTAHYALHSHDVLGDSPLLSWLFNIYHPSPGGAHTLNRGYPSMDAETPFANVHAPGFRAVYDFSDLDNSVYIISTGQSGHVLSPFYNDLGKLWSRGEYIRMNLDIELIRQSAIGVTVLSPDQ